MKTKPNILYSHCSIPLTGSYLFPQLPDWISGCTMSTDVHFHWKEELIKIILPEFHWPPWPLSVYYSLLPFSVSNAQQESILWEGLRGSPPWLHNDITWGTLKTTNAWILPLEILFNWYGVPPRHFLKAVVLGLFWSAILIFSVPRLVLAQTPSLKSQTSCPLALCSPHL